ncbi:MAG: Mov34/MPN/PAD-1 family protein [Nitrosopumilaceae archaeon]
MNLQKQVKLSQDNVKTLIKHAKNSSPYESCALLFGKIEDDSFNVMDVFLTKNIEDSPINFSISNDELIKGYQEAEKRKLDVVAIFHSHPDSDAYPSPTDKKFMETNPVPWIIFSNKGEELKAYIFEAKVIPLTLTVL